MLHGGGPARLKAGVQYVVINLAGSTLFLVAVGTLYAVTGTLNMADLAVKVPLVPEGDQALLRVGALLLLVVFGVKAALVDRKRTRLNSSHYCAHRMSSSA